MASLRARRGPATVVVALLVPTVVAAACTISSESPDAVALRGPAGGTTTTTGSGGQATGAAPAAAATEPEQETSAGDGPTSDTIPAMPAAPSGPDVGAAETPVDNAAAVEPPAATVGGEQDPPAEQPAVAEQGSEPAAGTATTGAGENADPGDAEPGGGDSGTGDDTPAPTTGTVVAAETAFDERSKVSTVGIGSVYFGMSPEEAAERVGTVWAGIPAGGADCYVITPTNGPPGVALWVYHGTVERVDIDTPLLRTQSGLGVGTHLGELRSSLGDKLVVEEHPYLAGWILATFVPTDPNDAVFRIAFDVSGGEVIRFRAGRTEIVALEGCA